MQICYLNAESSTVCLQIEGAGLLLSSTLQYQWERHYILPVNKRTVSGLHMLSAFLVCSLEGKPQICVHWHAWCLWYLGCSQLVVGSSWTGEQCCYWLGYGPKERQQELGF